MNLKRSVASLATIMLTVSGVAIAAPANAAPNLAVPIVSPTELTPPQPSANDKPLKGVSAPKGNGKVKSGAATSRSLLAGPYYYYAKMEQNLSSSGGTASGYAANLRINDTFVDTARSDYHSLGEIAVRSSSGQQIIEVGSTTDASVCGTTTVGGVTKPKTCLFTFRWVNGTPGTYNGSGFVEYATACNVAGVECAGDSLAADFGLDKRFQITHSTSGTPVWWVGYDGYFIGYYPDTVWTGATPSVTFNTASLFQGFYEVASSVQNTCTDLGNGILGSAASGLASRVGSSNLTNKVPTTIVNNFTASTVNVPASPVGLADVSALSAETMRGGGPMWNSAGTAAGITGGC